MHTLFIKVIFQLVAIDLPVIKWFVKHRNCYVNVQNSVAIYKYLGHLQTDTDHPYELTLT